MKIDRRNYLTYLEEHPEIREDVGERIRQLEFDDDELPEKLVAYIMNVLNRAYDDSDPDPIEIAESMFTSIVGTSLCTIVSECAEGAQKDE